MCPATVQCLAVAPASVQQLRAFPFLGDRVIDDLAAELPFYLAACQGVTFQGDNLAEMASQKIVWW